MAIVKINLSGHDIPGGEEFATHKLHVDLADPELCQKIVQFLKPMVGSSDVVHLIPCGLAVLAHIVHTAIHGLTGQHPIVFPPIRQADGTYALGSPIDLQAARNEAARTSRDGIVEL